MSSIRFYYYSFINATKVWWIAIKNPMSVQSSTLETIAKLYEIIVKTSEEPEPKLVEVSIQVNGSAGKKLVSMWMAQGERNPLDRIAELRDEVEELKILVAKLKELDGTIDELKKQN